MMKTVTKIKIARDGISFDRTHIAIDDCSNMSVRFTNEVGRTLTLRWIGTETDLLLPIWEFTVTKRCCGSIMCNSQLVGYGTYAYSGGQIVQIYTSSAIAA